MCTQENLSQRKDALKLLFFFFFFSAEAYSVYEGTANKTEWSDKKMADEIQCEQI